MRKNALNIEQIKKLFPIFQQQVHGYPILYLDSAATAQMPQQVIDAIVGYYALYKANVGRGVYTFSEHATKEYEKSRKKVAQFINASSKEIIVTSGVTHGINIVAQGWAASHLQAGDEILISEVEHHSNFVPWQQLARKKDLVLKFIPVGQRGIIEIEDFKKTLSSKTKFISVVHSSNILGTINDVKTITTLAHEVGAKVMVDAAQSVAHDKVDVQDIGCDFLSFSGHKLFGPTGVGFLYFNKDLFNENSIVSFGGGMVYSVTETESVFKEMPDCFEAGTQPIAQVIGMGAVIDFMNEYVDYQALQKHETALTKLLVKELEQFEDIEVVSHIPEQGEHAHLVTFVSNKYHAHDIAAHLDQYGIAVRAGNHCAQPFHQRCSLTASVRVSFSLYNSIDDVEIFIKRLKELYT